MVEQTNEVIKGELAPDFDEAMKTMPICKEPFYNRTEFNVNDQAKWFKKKTTEGVF